jgi:hypothetical protein
VRKLTKKEYIVVTVKMDDPDSYYKESIRHYVARRKEVENGNLSEKLPIIGLYFNDERDAKKVCDYLNKVFEKRVDERLDELFHTGEIELPFDFLKEWENYNEKAIIERFNRWNFESKYRGFRVTCHFKSDLIVFSNVPSDLSPFMICNILEIPYEPCFGAGTFCSEDMVLNVSKVKEYVR